MWSTPLLTGQTIGNNALLTTNTMKVQMKTADIGRKLIGFLSDCYISKFPSLPYGYMKRTCTA
jgi:hypothetical protein